MTSSVIPPEPRAIHAADQATLDRWSAQAITARTLDDAA
jgi:hypothetical protein